VFVGFDDEKLEDEVGRGGVHFLFPLHEVARTLEDGFELTLFAVLLVDFLGGAVDGDDEAVEATLDGALGVFIVKKVTVGGRVRPGSRR
jgi:hypothetical protein